MVHWSPCCCAVIWSSLLPFLSNMALSCQEVIHPLLSMSYEPDVMTAKRKGLIHAGAAVPFKLSWHSKARGNRAPLTVPAGLLLSIFRKPELLVYLQENRDCLLRILATGGLRTEQHPDGR